MCTHEIERYIRQCMCVFCCEVYLCPLEAVPGTAILMPRHAFMFIR